MAATSLASKPFALDDKVGRRRNRRQKPSFLSGDATQNPLSINTGEYSHLRTDQLLTFLNPAMSGNSNAAYGDDPRTMPDKQPHDSTAQTHLPAFELGAAALPPSSQQSTPSNYNLRQTDNNVSSPMAGGGVLLPKSPNKVIPPHLRKPANAPPSAKAGAQDIQAKLSELGVKVSKPESVAAPPASRTSSIAQGRSQTQPKSASSDQKCLDQAAAHTESNGRTNRSSGNDRGRGRGRGRGGRGRGGAGARNSRWPTSAEQRADPHRWTSNWDFEAANDEASSIDTMWADCGMGQSFKRAPASDGDDLADFSGGWAPAPINWDARPAFTNSDTVPRIEKWIHDTIQYSKGCEVDITSSDLLDKQAYEFAPRSWKPQRIEPGLSPSQWFAQLAEPKNPKPVDEGDLDGVVPWWHRYLSPKPSCFTLQLPIHPAKEAMDPDMNESEWVAYGYDHGVESHVERRKQAEMAKREAKAARAKRAEEKAQRLQERYGDMVVEKIRPSIKLYIRPATKADMVALRDIYNYYVRNSCEAPEMSDRSEAQMYQRLLDIRSAKLPFIVACERGAVMKQHRKKGKPKWEDGGDIILPDKIVGFACAEDWYDKHGIYRFTAELQVFVAPGSYMKGVGKCLLDKLIGLVDKAYLERGGYDVEGSEIDYTGPSREIENLIVNYSFDDPKRLDWVGRWLENWLDFRKVSDFPGIGNKNGKSVSLAHFMRKTGAEIDHANPPVPMPT